jgi:type II secretion system protein I
MSVAPSRGRNRAAARKAGFTLLEVLVATAIMGIAVAGVLSGISASARNAARLAQYDRATLVARAKMNELLVDMKAPRNAQFQGAWDAATPNAGWTARVTAFEAPQGSGPGMWDLDRIELEVWWMDGAARRAFTLEGFRRGILQRGDSINAR